MCDASSLGHGIRNQRKNRRRWRWLLDVGGGVEEIKTEKKNNAKFNATEVEPNKLLYLTKESIFAFGFSSYFILLHIVRFRAEFHRAMGIRCNNATSCALSSMQTVTSYQIVVNDLLESSAICNSGWPSAPAAASAPPAPAAVAIQRTFKMKLY